MDENLEKWQLALDTFKEIVAQVEYATWFKSLKFIKVEDNNIFLEVKNDVVRKLLNKRYNDLILDTIHTIYNENFTYTILLQDTKDVNKENSAPSSNINSNNNTNNIGSLLKNNFESGLNNKFTFDSYVVGGSNKLAYDASYRVANEPGFIYNPLYIYGDVGLGKTHLMQSIGNFIKENNPDKKVLYVTSEKFLSDFLDAVRFQKDTSEFRNKYRKADVLLVDDIQFFSGKSETQEEFFNTFNALTDLNKQIILTSDKPPQQIDNIDERLKSRFEMGLIVDIQSPSIDTRMAIINEKASQIDKDLTLPNDVVEFIADGIPTNVRRLEGAVQKLIAYHKLVNQPYTIQLAKEALKDLINQKPSTITISYIQEVVSQFYGLTIEDLKSAKRSKEIAYARQIAMYFSRKLTDTSFPKIGDEFGKKDHSTVMHAYEKIETDIKSSKEFKETIDLLYDKIKSI